MNVLSDLGYEALHIKSKLKQGVFLINFDDIKALRNIGELPVPGYLFEDGQFVPFSEGAPFIYFPYVPLQVSSVNPVTGILSSMNPVTENYDEPQEEKL
jgi:hypothetical protein